MRFRRTTLAMVVAILALSLAGAVTGVEDRLEQERNLGKAFYENPTTANEAVVEFRKALALAPSSTREKLNYALALLRGGKTEQAIPLLKEVQKLDPALPHTWFNLGIYYRKEGEAAKAIEQFQGMLRLTPDEPIPHYQLGALYRQTGKSAEAMAEFERASKLNPLLAGAHFQLYNLYRQAGRTADAAPQLQIFQELKKRQEGAAVAEDVDWCNYAEIYDPPRAASPVAASAPAFEDRKLANAVDEKTAGVALLDSTGKGQTDLLVWSNSGVTLYRQAASPVADSGLGELKGVLFVAPGDFDNDGLMDLCVLTAAGPELYRNTGGKFAKFAAALPQGRFERAVWLDYDHDYDLDLVLLGDKPALLRNQGTAGFADRTADFPFAAGAHPIDAVKMRIVPDSKAFDLGVVYSGRDPVIYRDQLGGHYLAAGADARAWDGKARDPRRLEADIDGDGKPDRVQVNGDGSVHYLHNNSPAAAKWIRVQLAGIRSLKSGQDAEIEIKAGTLYRKQMYEGVPVTFDLGSYPEADVVRITWMNGLIQNETKQAAGKAYRYEEAQRLSGSCPMIWTWDGHGFRFITDVLGVAPLGASDGEGSYFPVDHDEYVSIGGDALRPKDGHYEVRVTEELSEVSYLDQIQLIAVDHPAEEEIYTNEKFKSPPYPEAKLFGVRSRVYPVSARDDQGRDVRERLLRTDARYPDSFRRTELGVADRHWLELDFGHAAPAREAVLLLHGWVDWPDGSTFRAAAQEHKAGLAMPVLQMQDAAGNWKTVNADMGMPAGKPKTIAVPVQFPANSRKLRIATDLCVYWDEIFLSPGNGQTAARQSQASLESADLHFRGFSTVQIDALRQQPDTYSYAPVSATTFWNPTPGMYTRFGDVRELLLGVDDRMAIIGSGDELTLRFAAASLPPLPKGYQRDFLLKVDGWAKDRDPNTAFSTTVEPLPFHAMSQYPYGSGESFPEDEIHRSYRKLYNTRKALRLTRPLTD